MFVASTSVSNDFEGVDFVRGIFARIKNWPKVLTLNLCRKKPKFVVFCCNHGGAKAKEQAVGLTVQAAKAESMATNSHTKLGCRHLHYDWGGLSSHRHCTFIDVQLSKLEAIFFLRYFIIKYNLPDPLPRLECSFNDSIDSHHQLNISTVDWSVKTFL